VPILAVSSGKDAQEPQAALQNGAEDVLVRPLDAQELAAKVRAHLRQSSLVAPGQQRGAPEDRILCRILHLLEMKNRFLSMASHDVRTPVSTMKLVIDVMEGQLADADPDVRKLLGILARNLAKIEGKIEEFQIIARLDVEEDPEIHAGPVDLNAVVQDAIASFFPGAISLGVHLDAHLDTEMPEARGDAARLGQMTSNLIASSLERLADGQHMIVRTYRENDCAHIAVADDGVILPPDQIETLMRGLEEESPPPETRVALYAAYRIARAHGGGLTIAPTDEGGMVFCAWIPLGERRNAHA
jgi:signal transduction histidine kinase